MAVEEAWWRNAVGYQIYPRSFADSNQDGIGDLNGIREHLDDLAELGIDFLWLSPIYPSPNVDNGYDISDYRDIMEAFGTMEDFERLLEAVHEKGLRLIMDLVINHTSDQHPWFLASRQSKDNPYRDYYIWHPPRSNGELPSNWPSLFGGSAWEWDEQTQEYYLHIFAKEQPDLNWENPVLRQELYRMVRWWLDKGIDGFRIDAITHIKKRDLQDVSKKLADTYMNVEGIGVYLRELRQVFDAYPATLSIGEASGVPAADAHEWVGQNGYFCMIFTFDHVHVWANDPKDQPHIRQLKKALARWQYALAEDGWNALFMENHDLPRSVSVFGEDKKYWKVSAKALATLFMLLKGTPFIYQGQELGMTNVPFQSIDEIDAVDTRRHYEQQVAKGEDPEAVFKKLARASRDNARSPMQWDASTYAGFSQVEPWLRVNPNKDTINLAAEKKDPDSIWHYYRTLIQLRKSEEVLLNGTFHIHNLKHRQMMIYERRGAKQAFLILINLSKTEAVFYLPFQVREQSWTLVLSNYSECLANVTDECCFRPFETQIYQRSR